MSRSKPVRDDPSEAEPTQIKANEPFRECARLSSASNNYLRRKKVLLLIISDSMIQINLSSCLLFTDLKCFFSNHHKDVYRSNESINFLLLLHHRE